MPDVTFAHLEFILHGYTHILYTLCFQQDNMSLGLSHLCSK